MLEINKLGHSEGGASGGYFQSSTIAGQIRGLLMNEEVKSQYVWG